MDSMYEIGKNLISDMMTDSALFSPISEVLKIRLSPISLITNIGL